MIGTKTNCLAPVIRLVLLAWLASHSVSCTTPERTPAAHPPREDYSARRVQGRQMLKLADDLVMHADTISWDADGTTRLAGKVYFDGSRIARPERVGGWPEHAYAEVATWSPNRGTLALTGWPVTEYRTSTIVANTQGTTVWMNGDSMKITGGTCRIAWQASDGTSEIPPPQ